MRFPQLRRWLVLSLLTFTMPQAFPQTLMYNLVHLGTGTGTSLGINRFGDVVGTNGSTTAFMFSQGVVSTLAPAPSYANAINDSRQVALYLNGQANLLNPGSSPVPQGTLGGISAPLAINASGTMVGQSISSTDGQYHPFSASNGQITDLGTLGGSPPQCSANAINTTGTIVGNCRNAAGYMRAFRVFQGQVADVDPRTTTYDSAAYAINDSGDAAGYSDKSLCSLRTGSCRGSTTYAAIFHNSGTITSIGSLGGGSFTMALGMNNLGDVVGWGNTSIGQRAFIFTNGTMTDLNNATIANASGWLFTDADAINDSGQIVGRAVNPSTFKTEIVVLTPVPVFLVSLTINPSTVAGGNPSGGTVTLNRPAPSGGVAVQLSANNSAVQFPNGNTVNISPGASSQSFLINTTFVQNTINVTITGSFSGVNKSATLTVTNPGS